MKKELAAKSSQRKRRREGEVGIAITAQCILMTSLISDAHLYIVEIMVEIVILLQSKSTRYTIKENYN
jgi:hypothetical protein